MQYKDIIELYSGTQLGEFARLMVAIENTIASISDLPNLPILLNDE